MFSRAGYNSTVFTLDLGDKFDTSNVTNMSSMFARTGEKSTSLYVDCKNWNVSKVKSHDSFNKGVDTKVIAPIWVN